MFFILFLIPEQAKMASLFPAFLLALFGGLFLIKGGFGNLFEKINKCGQNSKLKDPYSIVDAYSNIECIDQCQSDDSCLAVTSCAKKDSTKWRTCEKNNNFTNLNNCSNQELNPKCSSWKKKHPCNNGGKLQNNCVCVGPYKGVTCQFNRPASCAEIGQMYLDRNQTAISKEYFLYTSNLKRFQVFCDFGKNSSFGYMYLPNKTLSLISPEEMKEVVYKNPFFMLRGRLKDSNNEREITIYSLPRDNALKRTWTFTLGLDKSNFVTVYPRSVPFMFVGGLTRHEVNNETNLGFVAGGMKYKFSCNDNYTWNYFVFSTNITSDKPTRYDYCKKWNDMVINLVTNPLPSEKYFYYPTFHFRCGAICLSKNFPSFTGMAPGFYFSV